MSFRKFPCYNIQGMHLHYIAVFIRDIYISYMRLQGATIQMQEGDNTSVRVARVMHGGAADRAG